MPKTDHTFDPTTYAPVADRIRLFYAAFPTGRIITELVRRTEQDVVFVARVYRSPTENEPAATGWAAEREGDGDINTVACLENTETSAIGRALANLGYTASAQRPSAEEMTKAARLRARAVRERVGTSMPRASQGTARYDISRDPLQQHAAIVTDLLRLIASAERLGLRPARATRWRSYGLSTSMKRATP